MFTIQKCLYDEEGSGTKVWKSFDTGRVKTQVRTEEDYENGYSLLKRKTMILFHAMCER